MTKLELTKAVVGLAVGSGASKIIHSIIKNNVQPSGVIDQITLVAGSIVLGSIAADASKKHSDIKIEEIADWWKKNVKTS